MKESDEHVEWIEVTWGPMTFSPVQFSSFRVGPFTARVKVQPGQTAEQAADKALASLQRLGEREFKHKADWFRNALNGLGSR